MIMNNFFGYPFLPRYCDKPPTMYAILESIVNGDKENEDDYVKIKDLAKEGRNVILNFEYPLTENISKEKFECMILNKFLMRRIGFDTVTAFRIQLDVKLNEIMPLYNKMFDALENWDIFNDGETTTRTGTNDKTTASQNSSTNSMTNNMTVNTENSNTNISDRRSSNTPQSALDNVRDGKYVTNYDYDTNTDTGESESTSTGTTSGTVTGSQNGTDNTEYEEITRKTPADKIAILRSMQTEITNIYGMIFEELEILFYGIE